MQDTLILLAIVAALVGVLMWTRPNTTLSPSAPAVVSVEKPKTVAKAVPHSKRRLKRAEKPVGKKPSLPTLYSSKKNKAVKQEKVVHGVPLHAFLKSQKNVLPSEVPQDAPAGVRVFFQCMELKKSVTAELNERDCNEMIATNTPNGRHWRLGAP